MCDVDHTWAFAVIGVLGNTARGMSRKNVEAFKRGLEAGNRGDVETLLEVLDPEVAWHSALHALMGGEATVYRGHDGVREMLRDLYDAFDEIHIEISDIRDLGDRLVAVGRSRMRGKASGVETESPLGFVTEVKNGKTISIRGYLDPKEALEAAGLRE
jgi:ketosteroid isomerase-like protein